MKKFLLSGLACTGLLLALPETALAHGGQYRGPSDVVPPNPGGSGGRTPGPSGPSTPHPSGPSTPAPASPSTPGPTGPGTGSPAGPGAAARPLTGGGLDLPDDLGQWQYWWEFNKDPFINLKAAIHDSHAVTASDLIFMGPGKIRRGKDTMKPTEAQILNEVLPKLNQALEATDNRDITSSCMVAMAKIGKNSGPIEILPIFEERLKSKDQEIRETAALAMGISQMELAVKDLVELVKDTSEGRKLMRRSEVDDRTRAFSAYGLGLVGFATSNVDVKRKIFDALETVLDDEDIVNRNIPVAVINAIGLLKPGTSDEKGKKLFKDCVSTLLAYYDKQLGTGFEAIQSHVPPAIAKLYDNVDENDAEIATLKVECKDRWLADIEGRSKIKRSSDDIVRSAVVALGRMADPYEDAKSVDKKYSEGLAKYYKKGKDDQAQYFALMALAMAGGKENRNELLIALQQGSKAMEKPWAALSLGVYCFNAMEEAGSGATVDVEVGRQLHSWLRKLKAPLTRSAIAVALGLCKYQDSADELREMLIKNKHQDEMAGYFCIGLALMDDQRSTQTINDLVAASVRRPERLGQAAIALGKLGDKTVTELLQKMMVEGDQNLAKMSAIASALGYIGDQRTISPLVSMLFDENLTPLSRAFAAVALGGVADKEPLPWNSKIGTNMNYRAAVETLTNQSTGILDIL